MKIYLIQDIIGLGYWSETYNRFTGYLYADHYSTKKEAKKVAMKLNKPVTIITIYKRNDK